MGHRMEGAFGISARRRAAGANAKQTEWGVKGRGGKCS